MKTYITSDLHLFHHNAMGYEYFQKALRNVLQKIQKDGIEPKIGLPYGIGCGLAGGNWNIIIGIITEAAEEFNIDIYLYKL